MAGNRLGRLISVDDHVFKQSGVLQDRVPSRHRDAAPRIVRDADGEAWVYEGKRMPVKGLQAVASKSREQFSPDPTDEWCGAAPGRFIPEMIVPLWERR